MIDMTQHFQGTSMRIFYISKANRSELILIPCQLAVQPTNSPKVPKYSYFVKQRSPEKAKTLGRNISVN